MILLAECKKRCDNLIVGLHTDPSIERPDKHKPIQTIYERYIQLAYHKSIYHVVPYDTERDLENLLATLDIKVRFLGTDYLNKYITGKEICEERNIEIEFIDRYHSWSSTELRERTKNEWLG